MKMVKSLLLGTAAGFVAVAGAQAADMPVKAAAVQYVKICNLYGDGFYYIPGTDICLKLGGYVRAQFYYHYGQNATATPFFAPNSQDTRFLGLGVGATPTFGQADYTMRARSLITVDTRQQTDYGVLRTYFIIGHTGDSPTAEGLYANRGFIQFAGFTFGLAQSFFDFFSAPAVSYFATHSEDTGDGGWKVAAFTANFGNGITSTLSAEEPRRIGVTLASVVGTGGPAAFTNPFIVGGYVPNDTVTIRMPDIVYNWRIDQAWGAAMIGGALHDASGGYYGSVLDNATTGVTTCAAPGFQANTGGFVPGGTTLTGDLACGHPADKLGWVVSGGLRFNIPGGAGSYFQTQGSYTEGALRYISHTQFPFGSPAKFGVGNSLGLGYLQDGIFGQAGEVELTKAWGIYASYDHFWSRTWRTSLYGGYLAIAYNNNAQNLIRAATCGPQSGAGAVSTAAPAAANSMAGGSITNMTNCNPDWALGYFGSRTQWNITSQFYMGVDILYTKLYTAFEGQAVYRAVANSPRPSGVYNIQNQDNIAFTFRVHRDFLP